jgi:hypothetical protein
MAELDLSIYQKALGLNKPKLVVLYDKKASLLDNFPDLEQKRAILDKIAGDLREQERNKLSIAYIADVFREEAARKYPKMAGRYRSPEGYAKFKKDAEEWMLAVESAEDLPPTEQVLLAKMKAKVAKDIRLLEVKGTFALEKMLLARVTFAEFHYIQTGRVVAILDEVFAQLALRMKADYMQLYYEQRDFESSGKADESFDDEDYHEKATADPDLKRKLKKGKKTAPKKAGYWEHY